MHRPGLSIGGVPDMRRNPRARDPSKSGSNRKDALSPLQTLRGELSHGSGSFEPGENKMEIEIAGTGILRDTFVQAT